MPTAAPPPLDRRRFGAGLIGLVALQAGCGGGDGGDPGPPGLARLEIVEGDGQAGPAGQALARTLVVRLFTASGFAASGVSVSFVITAGGGSVFTGTATSDVDGLARERWTLGTTAGAQRLEVRAIGSDNVARVWATFSATATAGPPAQIVAAAGNGQQAEQEQPLAQPLVARVSDAFGNPCSGIDVGFLPDAANGFATPVSARTDALGQAQTRWTLGVAFGTQQLRASVADIAAPLIFTANATAAPPGAPVRVVVAAGSGQLVTQHDRPAAALVAQVQDVRGNGVPGVTVLFSPGPGAGAISGGSAVSDASGRAEWRGWLHQAGDVSVVATLPGVAGSASASFALAVSAAGQRFDGSWRFVCTFSGTTNSPREFDMLLRDGEWLDTIAGSSFFPAGTANAATGAATLTRRVSLNFNLQMSGTLALAGDGAASGVGGLSETAFGSPTGINGTWVANRR
jgi:hypothetical protein